MSATADQELAELRRTSAALQKERDADLAALAQRDTEYGERIEYQAATINVLKAMSDSPDDPQPVLDMILRQAQTLCDCAIAALFKRDGTMLRCDSIATTTMSNEALEAYKGNFPRPLEAETTNVILAMRDRRIVHTRDGSVSREIAKSARDLGLQSTIAVPLVEGAVAIGAIVLGNYTTGDFTDGQIELLKTFAEQAVIAISSAETHRALHEALEQQTATAEVLQVINASPGKLGPVFEVILDKAMRLCQAGCRAVFDSRSGAGMAACIAAGRTGPSSQPTARPYA